MSICSPSGARTRRILTTCVVSGSNPDRRRLLHRGRRGVAIPRAHGCIPGRNRINARMGAGLRQLHQILAEHLMRTGLSAKMHGFARRQGGRVPSSDAELSALFTDNKPMVSLPLLHAAYIARDDLLNHCLPLQLTSRKAERMRLPFRCFLRSLFHRTSMLQTLRGSACTLPSRKEG